MAGFGFNRVSLGNGFRWRGLGEFGSYLEEQGQGRVESGRLMARILAGVFRASNDRDLGYGGGSGQRSGQ